MYCIKVKCREEVDNLDMNAIVKEFILSGDEKRQNIFSPP